MRLKTSNFLGDIQEIDGQEIINTLNKVMFPTGRFMSLVEQIEEEMEIIANNQTKGA